MELFNKLAETYASYETKIESVNGTDNFIIINPFWDENIRVSFEDGIIFFFSFQHAHFDYCDDLDANIDCLVEYINAFLSEKQVAVEFFQETTNLFGGSRCLDEMNLSSGKALLQSFAGDNTTLYETLYKQVKGMDCHCAIRGWNSASNKDIEITL